MDVLKINGVEREFADGRPPATIAELLERFGDSGCDSGSYPAGANVAAASPCPPHLGMEVGDPFNSLLDEPDFTNL